MKNNRDKQLKHSGAGAEEGCPEEIKKPQKGESFTVNGEHKVSEYKAHTNDKEIQTVKEHCENTSQLSAEFAVSSMKEINAAAGLLHDVGKYQITFQHRMDGENCRVEHSGCGAQVAKEHYQGPVAALLAYCIAGHHAGLPDGGVPNSIADRTTLHYRLGQEFEDYDVYKEELKIPDIDQKKFLEFLQQDCFGEASKLIEKFAFLTRYSFSCLVDADFIDTATFCQNMPNRQLNADFQACLNQINKKLSSFECETPLQKSRSILQKQVLQKTTEDAEIYLMNMPTGSGKTLCSMKFALERILRTKKKRIIYIAPYNGIIDQTAATFEEIFEKKAEVLRHQSSFSYEDEENGSEDYREAAKSATENWQAPIIISTMVQFFESIYSNKRGKLRKLHNMSDSILIFDEAHLMPRKYLQPCLQAIVYITKYLNSEAVFLTATMPDFTKLVREYALPNSKIIDLVEDTTIFKEFQKCTYKNLDMVSRENILEKAAGYPSSLIIVNKKKMARQLYQMAGGEKYHLSTYMTSLDRARVIEEIKEKLKQLQEDFPDGENVPEDRRIIIISTSLIEAGIDLDMYSVFREINGLDSILQSGGRCNREGKREMAEVYIFSFEEESTRGYGNDGTNLTKGLLEKYQDISCAESIKEYYDRLIFINREEIMDQSISKGVCSLESIPFKTYAQEFEIIHSPNESIVVIQDEQSKELVEALRNTGGGNARKMQKYVCTVNRQEFEDLYKQHAIEDYGTGIWCLTNSDYYDRDMGIAFEGKDHIL